MIQNPFYSGGLIDKIGKRIDGLAKPAIDARADRRCAAFVGRGETPLARLFRLDEIEADDLATQAFHWSQQQQNPRLGTPKMPAASDRRLRYRVALELAFHGIDTRLELVLVSAMGAACIAAGASEIARALA